MKSKRHQVLENSKVHEQAHIRNKFGNKKNGSNSIVLLIFSIGSAADQARLLLSTISWECKVMRGAFVQLSFLTEISSGLRFFKV
jgi:hypothetical protein